MKQGKRKEKTSAPIKKETGIAREPAVLAYSNAAPGQTSLASGAGKAAEVHMGSRAMKVRKSNMIEIRIADNTIKSSEFFSDRMVVFNLINAGIPSSAFSSIKDAYPYSYDDWAMFLDISQRTLIRYSSEPRKKFKSSTSEKILEVIEVTMKGIEVFGSEEKFNHWLELPNYALSGRIPRDLLSNSYGVKMILNELIRVEHGIFA